MGATVLAVAYSAPWLSSRVLKGNDLSYGLYIYHMPVVNVAVQSGTSGSPLAIAGILATSVALAFGSWKLIERPFLRRKRNALRVVTSATSGRGRDG
jgi:peptidoglycan/LPS O-acetylase OafA/YrhL